MATPAVIKKEDNFMGRLKRKRPASPKRKGRGKLAKDNKNEQGLKEQAAEGLAQKKVSPPKEITVAKKAVPKAIKPTGPKIKLAFWERTTQFLREVKIELKKVTWPSKKETIASTAVVIILVIIVSAFLGIVDFGLSSLIRFVLQ
ncbi:MAG: preprotein translocase subunit SecE [Thermodesulfobacteriota bacterium]|nr:preprotein translocase subunit SecE [Thermodesulfobacteriota bacterium]